MSLSRKPMDKKEKSRLIKLFIISGTASLLISIILLIFRRNIYSALITFFSIIALTFIYDYFKKVLDKSARVRKIELIFPDFLQLMSSNLRAGMTMDKAILLSSRPEFAPLDEELIKAGRELATGKTIEKVLIDFSSRIGSEKIHKTILLIISGIKAGGDLAILLEETSVSMRERSFIEKKAASNVLMYVIFIFLVVAAFAPGLFALSNVLVDVLTRILANSPNIESSSSLPFTMSNIGISLNFIKYFSLLFIITIDILASLILGLVSKGEEKEGLKYLPAILIISIVTFFLTQKLIGGFISGII